MIICKICGYETESILSQHLKRSHKMTSKEYLERYPEAEVTSESYKKMMSERNKSEKMRSITAERNRSEEMREVVRRRNQDPEFKKKCKAGYNNPETREKMRIRTSERNKRIWNNQEYRNKMSNILSESQKRYMNTDESKERMRRVMRKNWDDPEISRRMLDAPKSNWGYANRGVYFSERFDKQIRYKSQGELEFIQICESIDTITDIKYEPVRIKYKNRTYIPDFLVFQNDNGYLVEIKYDDIPENSLDKVSAALEYCKNNNLRFCWIRRFVELPILKDSKILSTCIMP